MWIEILVTLLKIGDHYKTPNPNDYGTTISSVKQMPNGKVKFTYATADGFVVTQTVKSTGKVSILSDEYKFDASIVYWTLFGWVVDDVIRTTREKQRNFFLMGRHKRAGMDCMLTKLAVPDDVIGLICSACSALDKHNDHSLWDTIVPACEFNYADPVPAMPYYKHLKMEKWCVSGSGFCRFRFVRGHEENYILNISLVDVRGDYHHSVY